MLTALVAGLENVLLSISQQLSSLETAHATEWVAGVRIISKDGGSSDSSSTHGKILKGHGLSLTRVAVLTGRTQSMLRVLSSLCWCNIVKDDNSDGDSKEEERCEWQVNPPPQGPALLSVLCRWVETADEQYRDVLQYLFACAAQPYLIFLRQWAFTITEFDPGHPYVIPQSPEGLVIRPILSNTATPGTILSSTSHRPPSALGGPRRKSPPPSFLPASLPGFLAHLEAIFLNTGAQLRLLHSVKDFNCRDVTAILCSHELSSANLNSNSATREARFTEFNSTRNVMGEESRWMRLGRGGIDASGGAVVIGNTIGHGNGTTTTALGGCGIDSSGYKYGEGTSSPAVELALRADQVDELLRMARNEGERKLFAVKMWLGELQEERYEAEEIAKAMAQGAAEQAAKAM